MTTKSGFTIELGIITRSNVHQTIENAIKELRHRNPTALQFFQREIEGAKSVPAQYRVLMSWFVEQNFPEENNVL